MKVGKVTSIDYNLLKVKISSEIRGSSVNVRGTVYYFGNVGNYLKVDNAVGESIICEVLSISDEDPRKTSDSFNLESVRELTLVPIGTLSKTQDTEGRKLFAPGVGIFPSLYSDVGIVTFKDMSEILHVEEDKLDGAGKIIYKSFTLGISKNLINYPVNIDIKSFFNIHTAVLGNSGSGKSNTIAHIIQEIYKEKRINYWAVGSKIIVFDVSGEYKKAFEELSQNKKGHGENREDSVLFYKPNSEDEKENRELFLPHFLLSLDEWYAFLMATDATQRPFWNKVLQEAYRFYKIGTSETMDEQEKFVNYLMYKVCSLIEMVMGRPETETARITSARGIVEKITEVIKETSNIISDIEQKKNLEKYLTCLKNACVIFFGENKETQDGERDLLITAVNKVKGKINKEDAMRIKNMKLKPGICFKHEFLSTAVEIVILEEQARGNSQMRNWVSTMLLRLEYFLERPECKFMREKQEEYKDSAEYLQKVFDISEPSSKKEQKQLIVIDVSELSPDILEVLTGVLSRLIFDHRKDKKGEARRKNPVHLILDEAHRYVKKDYDYKIKENIFEKIAREGRKYSYYLLLSSQRPSELSETVLSQCGNFIVHNIRNEKDMRYIRDVLPYFSDGHVGKVKQSVPGEGLIFGNCVAMPLHVRVNPALPPPDSENCDIPAQWFRIRYEKINQVQLPAKDLKAVQKFFDEVFAWSFTPDGEDYLAFSDGVLNGGFYRDDKCSDAAQGAALLMFYSEDLEGTEAKIVKADGEIVKPVFSFPGGRRFHFCDPNGNEYAVWSDKPAQEPEVTQLHVRVNPALPPPDSENCDIPAQWFRIRYEKINQVQLPAKDLKAVQKFFDEVFAWSFTPDGEDYLAFSDGVLNGGFYRDDKCSDAAQGAALLMFYSEDLEGTEAKIVKADGEIVKPVFSFPGGRRFHFCDPNGNEYAVWSDKAATE